MNFSQKDIDRFWKKVDIKSQDECWNWTGSIRTKNGYGGFSVNGTTKGAHCCSLFLEKGEAPLNKPLALHLCKENRKCVNPKHLYYGDHPQNYQDQIRDGTQARGERHGHSKLNETQVREIRGKYIPCEYTVRDLAEEYKVCVATIRDIINNKSWRHVV